MSTEKVNEVVPIASKTDEELKKIAMDIFDGQIFSSGHVRDTQDLASVFMPILLGAFGGWGKEKVMDIGLIYEYLSEAGPRAVNGMPSFFSLQILSVADTIRMEQFHKQYEELKNSFLVNTKNDG